MNENCTLTLQCNDRRGLVADVATFLAAKGANIVDSQQFNDRFNGRFFMRVEFELGAEIGLERVAADFAALAERDEMDWKMKRVAERTRTLMLVSRFDHCLGDLLYRYRIGELSIDPVGVICNHPREVLSTSLMGSIPFFHLPVTRETKATQEDQIKQIVESSGAELVVLTRYMQILSEDLAGFLSGRCINIHHSFLPGFKGARPYHQAHQRGVKMIGATAHYVTGDLDEGPIIHQDVEAVGHADTPEDLVRKGRDIERRVIATAVRHHIEGRVFRNGNSTVVFKA